MVEIILFLFIQAFAKEGAHVMATDINGEKLKELDSYPSKFTVLSVYYYCHLVANFHHFESIV